MLLPEIGYFCLLIAITSLSTLLLFSLWGEVQHQYNWLKYHVTLSLLSNLAIVIAFLSLVYSFCYDDFSVRYVAMHSNRQLPLLFKIGASWGGYEGSLLFWLTALSSATMLFCVIPAQQHRLFRDRTLTVLALIKTLFMIFILFFSNPFVRYFPIPPEGSDLNPMLQDIGLVFHPPLLYLGYVGFAMSFAMIVAMIMEGKWHKNSVRMLRFWVIYAWGILTAGIMLGAWWAYYELGWGGWWFWDPVENASLMPWLIGTALLHNLVVSEKRGAFHYWSMLLTIIAFGLSLFGTFIVRSGMMSSIHSFAFDTANSTILLLLFFILIFFAFSLFASAKLRFRPKSAPLPLLSKVGFLGILNGLFCVATFVVILGTLYPVIFSALGGGSLSVGAPYFNTLFIPLSLPILMMMGFAPILRWENLILARLKITFWRLILSVLLAQLIILNIDNSIAYSWRYSIIPLLFNSLAIFVILTHIPTSLKLLRFEPLVMRLAHIGFACCVIGAIMSSYYANEKSIRLGLGEKVELSGFQFHYQHYQDTIGQNYTAEEATFSLTKNGKIIASITPEKRYYDIRRITMSEVGIYHYFLHDLYMIMGDKFERYQYAFRVYYKPYVRLLWIGAGLMVLSALLAMFVRIRGRIVK